MACGTPVIASKTTSLLEAVGKAAVLIDPLSVDELATAIERVASDAELRTELHQRGLAQAARFNWAATAAAEAGTALTAWLCASIIGVTLHDLSFIQPVSR